MDKNDLINQILKIKNDLDKKITIPAHHYQNIDIVNIANFVGDSYKLSVDSSKTDANYIVFCGVKFMAESAKILSKQNQKVLIPNIQAGCPMADMIDINNANKVFDIMSKNCENEIIPVVYMNSYADMKSFCGEKGGAVCTSSNAQKIIDYYFKQNKSVFFFPDYHLGKNTANKMGIAEEFIVKVKKDATLETKGNVKKGKLFLWDGFCHVHQTFNESDIATLRDKYHDIKIIVHPECKENIVKLADLSGSTEQIYNVIKNSPSNSIWAIGTEAHFIERMALEFNDKTILPLRVTPCFNMEKITLTNLLLSLQSIVDFENNTGELKYEINVSEEFKHNAKKSLQKMIEIVEG